MDFTKLSADLDSQPITGYLPDGRYIDIPLISHIEDNLYVGGWLNADLGDFFSHIFSLYHWKQYRHAESTLLHAVEMYDSHSMPVDVDSVLRISTMVSDALDEGGNVLVHCQAGINRSNLIAATTLIRRGRTPDEAIALLREKRSPLVLANHTFENFLRNQLQEWLDLNPSV